MRPLVGLVREYFEAEGFHLLEEHESSLVVDRLLVGGARDTRILFVLPDGESPKTYEPRIARDVDVLTTNYPSAKGTIISPVRSGFSPDFRAVLVDLRIPIRSPAHFFDTEYAAEAGGVGLKIGKAGRTPRVSQPFARGLDARPDTLPPPGVGDAADFLLQDIRSAAASCLRLVVGPAGMGKTMLADALYTRMYDEFIAAKESHRLLPRPIAFGPKQAQALRATRAELLIERFLSSELATPVRPPTFEWLLTQGFSVWQFDGLDEMYSGDPEFFGLMEELLTRPGSRAQIVIFSRDSVIANSRNLQVLLDIVGPEAGTAMFRGLHLTKWSAKEKRAFAWLRLEGTLPTQDAREPASVSNFVNATSRNRVLSELSGVPFYLGLLADLFVSDSSLDFPDDTALVNSAIEDMLAREKEKKLIDIDAFETNGIDSWLEQIADLYVNGGYTGVPVAESDEYAELVLRPGTDTNVAASMVRHLAQSPFFVSAGPGTITFAHELVAEALAARLYARRMPRDTRAVARALAASYDPGRFIFRFLAQSVRGPALDAALNELRYGAFQKDAQFAALLHLVLLARPERDFCKRENIVLSARVLQGVTFTGRDLSNVSFVGSDLSDTVFQECDLTDANLSGSYLSRTRFIHSSLTGCIFSEIARVESVYDGTRCLEDPSDIKTWMEEATGRYNPKGDPCPTALQFLTMFRRYVDGHGGPRRDLIRVSALRNGRHVRGAPNPMECVRAAVSWGYLSSPDHRDRCRRAEGDGYREIVELVRDGRVSDGLGSMVASLCTRGGCLHQVRS